MWIKYCLGRSLKKHRRWIPSLKITQSFLFASFYFFTFFFLFFLRGETKLFPVVQTLTVKKKVSMSLRVHNVFFLKFFCLLSFDVSLPSELYWHLGDIVMNAIALTELDIWQMCQTIRDFYFLKSSREEKNSEANCCNYWKRWNVFSNPGFSFEILPFFCELDLAAFTAIHICVVYPPIGQTVVYLDVHVKCLPDGGRALLLNGNLISKYKNVLMRGEKKQMHHLVFCYLLGRQNTQLALRR